MRLIASDRFFDQHFFLQAPKVGYRSATRGEGFVERGFSKTEDQAARFAALPGGQPRTYSSFAEELAKKWAAA